MKFFAVFCIVFAVASAGTIKKDSSAELEKKPEGYAIKYSIEGDKKEEKIIIPTLYNAAPAATYYGAAPAAYSYGYSHGYQYHHQQPAIAVAAPAPVAAPLVTVKASYSQPIKTEYEIKPAEYVKTEYKKAANSGEVITKQAAVVVKEEAAPLVYAAAPIIPAVAPVQYKYEYKAPEKIEKVIKYEAKPAYYAPYGYQYAAAPMSYSYAAPAAWQYEYASAAPHYYSSGAYMPAYSAYPYAYNWAAKL